MWLGSYFFLLKMGMAIESGKVVTTCAGVSNACGCNACNPSEVGEGALVVANVTRYVMCKYQL